VRDKTVIKTVHSQLELKQLFSKGEDIANINITGQREANVTIKCRQNATFDRSGNCILGAHISSLTRISVHKALNVLPESALLYTGKLFFAPRSSTILTESIMHYFISTDTDSAILALPKKYVLPFKIGPSYGEWKHVLPPDQEIIAFASLGVKNYCLQIEDQTTGEILHQSTISGLNLKTDDLQAEFSTDMMRDFLDSCIARKEKHIMVPQRRVYKDKASGLVYDKKVLLKYRNSCLQKRVLLQDMNYQSLPYGYTSDLKDKVRK
jgi:hypothetical protein